MEREIYLVLILLAGYAASVALFYYSETYYERKKQKKKMEERAKYGKEKTRSIEDVFSLENQYRQYLKRVSLEESRMGQVQKTELKRAFMGAWGQLLVLLHDEIGQMTDDEAVSALEYMKDQVSEFFMNEVHRKN